MNFLESEKSKAIRWFRNFAELLESGQAELLPSSLVREDYGHELRLSGSIVPAKKASSPPKINVSSETRSTVSFKRMSPSQAQQCYDVAKRVFTCPICNSFSTKSERGLKKHANRCTEGG